MRSGTNRGRSPVLSRFTKLDRGRPSSDFRPAEDLSGSKTLTLQHHARSVRGMGVHACARAMHARQSGCNDNNKSCLRGSLLVIATKKRVLFSLPLLLLALLLPAQNLAGRTSPRPFRSWIFARRFCRYQCRRQLCLHIAHEFVKYAHLSMSDDESVSTAFRQAGKTLSYRLLVILIDGREDLSDQVNTGV